MKYFYSKKYGFQVKTTWAKSPLHLTKTSVVNQITVTLYIFLPGHVNPTDCRRNWMGHTQLLQLKYDYSRTVYLGQA